MWGRQTVLEIWVADGRSVVTYIYILANISVSEVFYSPISVSASSPSPHLVSPVVQSWKLIQYQFFNRGETNNYNLVDSAPLVKPWAGRLRIYTDIIFNFIMLHRFGRHVLRHQHFPVSKCNHIFMHIDLSPQASEPKILKCPMTAGTEVFSCQFQYRILNGFQPGQFTLTLYVFTKERKEEHLDNDKLGACFLQRGNHQIQCQVKKMFCWNYNHIHAIMWLSQFFLNILLSFPAFISPLVWGIFLKFHSKNILIF